MAIAEKNFTQPDPADIPKDAVYERCNFSRTQPADATEGAAVGVRLFPGDDTPRTFIDCNLFNCEPPPGSLLQGCNTWIVETGITPSLKEDDVVEVDGVEVSRTVYHDRKVLARYVDGAYQQVASPVPEPEDY